MPGAKHAASPCLVWQPRISCHPGPARSTGRILPAPMAGESGSNELSNLQPAASAESLPIDRTGNFLPGTKSFPTISCNHLSSTFSIIARAADPMFQQSGCLDHLQLRAPTYLNAGEEQKLDFCQSNEQLRVPVHESAARTKHRGASQRPCRGGRAIHVSARRRQPGTCSTSPHNPAAAALTASRSHPGLGLILPPRPLPAASYAEPRAGGNAARCPGAPRRPELPLDPSPWQRGHSPSPPLFPSGAPFASAAGLSARGRRARPAAAPRPGPG